MPRELTRQLDEAVAEVFAVMLNLACTAAPTTELPAAGFSASVRFSGTMEGVCSVHFERRTAAELTANLVGMPAAEVPLELCADTAGELCNMIAGSWKTRQPDVEAACHLSCPTHSEESPSTQSRPFEESITLLYNFQNHLFAVRLAVD